MMTNVEQGEKLGIISDLKSKKYVELNNRIKISLNNQADQLSNLSSSEETVDELIEKSVIIFFWSSWKI